ncbi:BCCT family transporter [Sphingobacterium corticibacter]|uniref:Transporter n=1 Tax=Sphingobacterium corticibacter TaxID=2171749 RepID=A0A2T8HMG0_9SPHI|nr:BCCT family transporter [Sphingobacterium corticibacter]PVH26615.1 transporter [Sphingobacterium corticibacter]
MKLKKHGLRTSLDLSVTIPSLIFILGVCLFSAILPQATEAALTSIKVFVFINLNWVYVWAITIFVLFLGFLTFSKYGNIKLGPNDSKPAHSFFSWVAMLFAAGMGIGLMYFSVAEPMTHYTTEAFSETNYQLRAKNAQLYTFFHYGIHAWAIYGLVGLCLAYFAFRYKLPLSLRSCLYPLLKDKMTGRWGTTIDVFALCSTFFGITTTLGFGVVQINSGLQKLGILPETSFTYQALLVSVLVSLSIISAISGVDKGIKLLSNINILAAIVLMLFVLSFGPTNYLIGAFTDGVGNYINNFFALTFDTHIYDEQALPWFYNWTILYWAWWISWAPFVGLFIAKISRGRTIREFIAAVLIIPTFFIFIWMTVFGNSAIWTDAHVADGALGKLVSDPDSMMFEFLNYLPSSQIASALAILIVIIFFVTSADSGILVMNTIATRNAKYSPKWQTIFWGVLLALLALMLLNAGGLQSLQIMTLITALPFAVIMVLFTVSLMKALVIDQNYYDSKFSVTTIPWSGESWKERLKKMVNFKSQSAIKEFIDNHVEPAFKELKAEFESNGIVASINKFENPLQIEISIAHEAVDDFVYGVKCHRKLVAEYFMQESNLPDVAHTKTYYPKTYFGDGRDGYDVKYFTKNELISDVLKHYDRFLEIVSQEDNELFISNSEED